MRAEMVRLPRDIYRCPELGLEMVHTLVVMERTRYQEGTE